MPAHQKGTDRRVQKESESWSSCSSSCQSAIRHIRSIAPPSLVTDASSHTYTAGDSPVAMSDLECPICSHILDQPVELIRCRSHVCTACRCEWLKVSDTFSCPCCYIDHFHDFSSIRQGSTLILKLLGGSKLYAENVAEWSRLQTTIHTAVNTV